MSSGSAPREEGAGEEPVCRLCLVYREPGSGAMCSLYDPQRELAARLRDLAPHLPICRDDGLPITICTICTEKVEAFHTFLKQMENSYEILKSQYSDGVLNIFENPTIITKSIVAESSISNTSLRHNPSLPESNKNEELLKSTIELPNNEDLVMLEMYTKINEQLEVAPRVVETCAVVVQLPDGSSLDTLKKYICLICLNQFVAQDIDIISTHVDSHFSQCGLTQAGPNFICELCSKMFTNRQKLILHQRAHLKIKPFVCELCKSAFGNFELLESHSNITDCRKLNLFSCEHCGKQFKLRLELSDHIKIHYVKNKLECELCTKKMYNLTSFKRHMKRHFAEKQFTCEICAKSYYTSSHLKKHKLTHNSTKPHLCSICGNGYLNISELNRHLDYHYKNKSHKCDYCKEMFTDKSNLSRHLEAKHGTKSPVPCEICGKIFLTLARLKRHILRHPPVLNITESLMNMDSLDVVNEEIDDYQLDSIEPSIKHEFSQRTDVQMSANISSTPDQNPIILIQPNDSVVTTETVDEESPNNNVMLYILSGDTISFDTQGTNVVE